MPISPERRQEALKLLNAQNVSSGISPERRKMALEFLSQQQPAEESLARQALEGTAEGVLDIADLPQAFAAGVRGLGNVMQEPLRKTMEQYGDVYDQPPLINLEQFPLASQGIKKYLKEKTGIGLDTKPSTTAGKVLRTAGRFGGSSLAGGALGAASKTAGLNKVGNILGAAENLPQLAKMTGYGAGLGAGVGIGENVLGLSPEGSLGLSIAGPAAIKGTAKGFGFLKNRKSVAQNSAQDMAADILQKQVGEQNIPQVLKDLEEYQAPLPGYNAPAAERTQNVGLSQLQRAHYGHTPALGEQQAKNDALIKQALESIEAPASAQLDIAQRVNPYTAGKEYQSTLSKNIENLKKEREKAYHPEQKAIEAYKHSIYPEKAYAAIDKELKTAKGDIKDVLLEAKDYLRSNTTKKQKSLNIDERFPAEIKEKIKSEHSKIASGEPSAHELSESLEQIGDLIEQSNRSGAFKKGRVLKSVQEALKEDLEHTPVGKAKAVYAEKSEPISRIEEKFGQELQRDVFNKRFLLREDKASKSIIEKSMQNEDYAKIFNEQFSNNPKSVKVTKGYINNELNNKIIDKNGKVNLGRLHSWRISNPYAEKIYPGLSNKLDNLQHKGLIDQLEPYLTEKGITHDKLSKYIKRNEAMLRDSFDENQMQLLKGSEKALRARSASEARGKAIGSPTSSNLTLLEAIETNVPEMALKKAASGSLTGKAATWLYDFFRAAKKAKHEELIKASLTDPELTKMLLTRINEPKNLNNAANKLKGKPYIPRVLYTNWRRKEEE